MSQHPESDTSTTEPGRSPASTATTSPESSSASPATTQPGSSAASPTPAARPQGGSASPATVARSVARTYAKLLFIDAGPPNPSTHQIDAAARLIVTSCTAPRYGQYPCVIHPPNRTPPVQACAAVANAAGDVGVDDLRCGDRAAPFPIVRPGYVDCARVGHVVTIRGRSAGFSQIDGDHRDDLRADLLAVRIAATSHQLCWDFETAAPPAPREQLFLGVTGSTPGVDFDSPGAPSAQDGNSSIPGQAGRSGAWTSLLVDASQLDPPLPSFPSRFSFVADAEWNNTALGAQHADGEDTIHGRYP